jgi:hypothetical protein
VTGRGADHETDAFRGRPVVTHSLPAAAKSNESSEYHTLAKITSNVWAQSSRTDIARTKGAW